MKYSYFALLILISYCCKKDDNIVIPRCIKNQYALSTNSNLVVKQWTSDDNTYYFFNTGAVTHDGAEYIYDEECNEYCYYCGFCLPPKCLEDFPSYNSEEWIKVLPE